MRVRKQWSFLRISLIMPTFVGNKSLTRKNDGFLFEIGLPEM